MDDNTEYKDLYDELKYLKKKTCMLEKLLNYTPLIQQPVVDKKHLKKPNVTIKKRTIC